MTGLQQPENVEVRERNNLHPSQFEFDTHHLDGYQDDTPQDAPRKHGGSWEKRCSS